MEQRSSLAERIEHELHAAMKAREKVRTSALRMARAALKNREIEKRAPLEDADVIQVLATQAKQRRESIEQFRAGGREDLAAKEEQEFEVLREFLPEELTASQLKALVEEAIREVGAASPKDLGRVMSALMPKVRGRADGRAVNEMVRAVLAGGESL